LGADRGVTSCCGLAPAARTICLFKDTTGSIFGGYSENPWNSSNSNQSSPSNFLFCLYGSKAPAVQPFKMPATTGCIQGHSSFGPIFGAGGAGAGNDFYINSDGRTCIWNVSSSYTANGAMGSHMSSTGGTTTAEEFDVYTLA
jgi:hypothetical protein